MNTGNPSMPLCEKCGASPVRQYLNLETGRSTSRCPEHDEYLGQPHSLEKTLINLREAAAEITRGATHAS